MRLVPSRLLVFLLLLGCGVANLMGCGGGSQSTTAPSGTAVEDSKLREQDKASEEIYKKMQAEKKS